MKDVKRAQDLIGSEVYDREGDRIGKVGNVYVDDANHQPEWVTVRTGFFGTKESFVPLSGAERGDKGINVEVTKDKVRDAPQVDAEHGHLSDKEGHDLYSYYGLQQGSASPQPRDVPRQQSGAEETEQREAGGAAGGAAAGGAAGGRMASGQATSGSTTSGTGTGTSGTTTSGTTTSGMTTSGTTTSGTTTSGTGTSGTTTSGAATAGTGTSGMTSSGARGTSSTTERSSRAGTSAGSATAGRGGGSTGAKSMVRSEERLRINTEQVETGRVRVRKYVVTEHQTVTVPISHEEIRIEREPITESERGSMRASSALGEEEQEIVLHEDRPTVSKETVPVERIRMHAELVTEEKTMQDEVRRERFDVQDRTEGGKHERADDSGGGTSS